MGYQLNADALNTVFAKWSDTYDIYAPKLFAGTGRSSMQDIVRYGKITKPEEIVWDKRSDYSAKDVLLPVCQTLFYFNENTVTEAEAPEKGAIILLRSCDLHAIKRFDYMYLQNGPEDYYYKRVRDRVKFVLMGCSQEFENCFCVSMGTNTSDNYDVALNFKDGQYFLDIKDDVLGKAVTEAKAPEVDVVPDHVTENKLQVHIPENLSSAIAKSHVWDEYDKRCIKCGRCTLACPTCTCWSMQDVFFTEDHKAGERRRVQTSCMFDDYTLVAGGLCFRKKAGERMRFKVLHKTLEFKQRSGFQMCVGCGRCDAICPEYISLSHCINVKLPEGMKEVTENE